MSYKQLNGDRFKIGRRIHAPYQAVQANVKYGIKKSINTYARNEEVSLSSEIPAD